jgi:membrane protease YdiL (CAAX protease family)
VSDGPEQPASPPPDPWARPEEPGEPDGPSWKGPWSDPGPDQTGETRETDEQSSQDSPLLGSANRPPEQWNGWGAAPDQAEPGREGAPPSAPPDRSPGDHYANGTPGTRAGSYGPSTPPSPYAPGGSHPAGDQQGAYPPATQAPRGRGAPWGPGRQGGPERPQPPGGPWIGRPDRTPLPEPPARPQVLWLELGLVLVLAFAPGALSLLVIALGAGGNNSASEQLVPAIVSGLFSAFLSWSPVLLIGYLLFRNNEGWRGIGLTRFDPRADGVVGLGLWITSFVLVLVLAIVFSPLGGPKTPVDFLPKELPIWFRVIDALVIAVTAGVTEEIVVRGYAQTRLEQLKVPTAVVLLLPTALWGVLHLYEGPAAALTIFCLGMLYAWYFFRTRRLWPIIIAHALFDLTQLGLLLAGLTR